MPVALVLMEIKKGRITETAKELGKLDEVTEAYSVAGRHDLVAKVQVEEYERFSEVIPEKFQEIEGIEGTETLMAFKTYKL